MNARAVSYYCTAGGCLVCKRHGDLCPKRAYETASTIVQWPFDMLSFSFKPEAIIFDFDGVVADSETLANTLLAAFLTEEGLPTRYEDALDRYKGRRWSDVAALIGADLGMTIDETFRERYRAFSRGRMREEVGPVPGVDHFLQRRGDLKLGVASSSNPEWLAHCVTKFDFGRHFGRHLYSATAVERGKPAPDIFLHAADGLNVAAPRCIVIEDSPAGIVGARAADMVAIGFVGASHARASDRDKLLEAGAHAVVASYDELDALLLR